MLENQAVRRNISVDSNWMAGICLALQRLDLTQWGGGECSKGDREGPCQVGHWDTSVGT